MTHFHLNESNATVDEPTAVETVMPIATALTLLKFGLPAVILLGTIGNVLSFAVLLRRSMRSIPMYFYLMLLAVADTMVLYTSAFKTWIRLMTGFEALHVSDVGCKLITFLLLNSLYLSAWLIVLVTLDRFLVVWFPFRGYLMMRIRQARYFAALLTAIISIYNMHVFWTFGLRLDENNGSPKCQSIDKSFFSEHVFEYLKLISYCAVPFAVVAALNVGIIVRISQAFSRTFLAGVGNRTGCQSPKNCRNTTSSLPKQSTSPHNPAVCDNKQREPTRPQSYGAQFRRVPLAQRQSMLPPDNPVPAENSRSPSLATSVIATITVTNPVAVTTSVFMEDAQRKQQRRLTRMLLFISFAWLVLTAPFTLHSFIPERSPSESSDTASSNAVTSKPNLTSLSDTAPSNAVTSEPNLSSLSSFSDTASSRPVTSESNASSTLLRPSLDEVSDDDSSTEMHRSRLPFLIDAKSSSFHSPTHSSPSLTDTQRHNCTMLPFLLVNVHYHDVEHDQAVTQSGPITERVVGLANGRDDRSKTAVNNAAHRSMMFLVKTICFLLVYVNHASNFYLYCVSGRRFRYELRAMFRSVRRQFRRLRCRRGGIKNAASNVNSVMMAQLPMRQISSNRPVDVRDVNPGKPFCNPDDTNGSCSAGGALHPSHGDSNSSHSSRSKITGTNSMGSKKVSKLDLAALYN